MADEQGRVELRINEQRYVVCGDGWALNEAQVVCKQLGMGFAENVLHLKLLDEEPLPSILSGISCNGNESRIAQCSMSDSNEICPEAYENIAGVACAPGIVIEPGPRRVWSPGRIRPLLLRQRMNGRQKGLTGQL